MVTEVWGHHDRPFSSAVKQLILCTITNGHGYHLWRVMPLKEKSIAADDLRGTLLEVLCCQVICRLTPLRRAFSDRCWAHQCYVDGWIMWRTLISSGWIIMDLHILQMNKTTAVSIWRLVPNFPLLNAALFGLTTQSRPANTEPSEMISPINYTLQKSTNIHIQ